MSQKICGSPSPEVNMVRQCNLQGVSGRVAISDWLLSMVLMIALVFLNLACLKGVYFCACRTEWHGACVQIDSCERERSFCLRSFSFLFLGSVLTACGGFPLSTQFFYFWSEKAMTASAASVMRCMPQTSYLLP
eukprot:1161672-Pelagomonas_calceolata.AAC.4